MFTAVETIETSSMKRRAWHSLESMVWADSSFLLWSRWCNERNNLVQTLQLFIMGPVQGGADGGGEAEAGGGAGAGAVGSDRSGAGHRGAENGPDGGARITSTRGSHYQCLRRAGRSSVDRLFLLVNVKQKNDAFNPSAPFQRPWRPLLVPNHLPGAELTIAAKLPA